MHTLLLFFYSLALLLAGQTFFPTYNLIPFTPLLVISAFIHTKKKSLVLSLCLGLFLDCLNNELPFGFFLAVYSLSTLFLSSYRIYFSQFFFSLLLYLFLFAYTLTLFQDAGLLILGKLPYRTLHTLIWRPILPCLLNSALGMALFFIPSFFFQSFTRWIKSFFFTRKFSPLSKKKR
ncbi:hypothetical protein COB21_00215 [Candidatus Aerophobetes bacterium]|uniref:Rod shape-determining protein MreD n=1 Tax=Aerophobetes bacterium TaxID=2030807 RepID=A0A2A4X9N5_UNCAE|nr:MAG: hypothetical protein COB21_00215 [Candidatus Aerophobetes bacterium]